MTKKPAYGSNTSSRYNMARIELELPTRICNAAMPHGEQHAYKGTAWNIRSDGENHKKFKSKGA